jgi:CheY-like chemotaxis protein
MTPMPLSGLKLLIVEDEALVAMMLERMLTDLGANVVELAGNLTMGLALFDQPGMRLDAAVLDVNLGGDKVYPIAERLAEREVPFIFSTGYGIDGISRDFAHVPVLSKPFSPEALATTLRSVLPAA